VVSKSADWVLLSYRVPREPSTPRIAIWRKLKDLGVAQIGDGLVALPRNDRTRERLQWIAVSVREAGGGALVWDANLSEQVDAKALRSSMSAERAEEYATLLAEVQAATTDDGRTIQKWRRHWQAINRRDYFGADGADEARLAIADRAGADLDENAPGAAS